MPDAYHVTRLWLHRHRRHGQVVVVLALAVLTHRAQLQVRLAVLRALDPLVVGPALKLREGRSGGAPEAVAVDGLGRRRGLHHRHRGVRVHPEVWRGICLICGIFTYKMSFLKTNGTWV